MTSRRIQVQFSGGAELLFNKVKNHDLTLPEAKEPWTIRTLLVWMKDNMLKERPELFLQGETVRPGILVLVNDADWELMGELDYHLQDNDTIVFISTLHGGWLVLLTGLAPNWTSLSKFLVTPAEIPRCSNELRLPVLSTKLTFGRNKGINKPLDIYKSCILLRSSEQYFYILRFGRLYEYHNHSHNDAQFLSKTERSDIFARGSLLRNTNRTRQIWTDEREFVFSLYFVFIYTTEHMLNDQSFPCFQMQNSWYGFSNIRQKLNNVCTSRLTQAFRTTNKYDNFLAFTWSACYDFSCCSRFYVNFSAATKETSNH